MASPGINPQGGAPTAPAEAPTAPPQGGAQANPLQTTLAQLAKACEQLAQQNAVVQPELMQCRAALIQALRKTMMASQPQQPSDAPAPPQG